jgi:hypothetical protein
LWRCMWPSCPCSFHPSPTMVPPSIVVHQPRNHNATNAFSTFQTKQVLGPVPVSSKYQDAWPFNLFSSVISSKWGLISSKAEIHWRKSIIGVNDVCLPSWTSFCRSIHLIVEYFWHLRIVGLRS